MFLPIDSTLSIAKLSVKPSAKTLKYKQSQLIKTSFEKSKN